MVEVSAFQADGRGFESRPHSRMLGEAEEGLTLEILIRSNSVIKRAI